jgi:secreted protein with Ig-like and vWFA domain
MSSNHKDQNLDELDEANLTAYALGQLEGQELAEVESMLLRSEKARQFVQETTHWAGQLRNAYQSCPSPEPSSTLRDTLETELQKTSKSQLGSRTMTSATNQKRSFKRFFLGFSIVSGVAAILVAFLLPAIHSARAPTRIAHTTSMPHEMDKAETSASPAEIDRKPLYDVCKPVYETKTKELPFTVSKPEFAIQQVNNGKPATHGGKPADKYSPQSPNSWLSANGGTLQPVTPPQAVGLQTGLKGEASPYYLDNGAIYDPRLREGKEFNLNSAPNTEQYDPIHDNPFLPVSKEPLSTFSIDVDTASYANVRRFLREGRLPPPDAVRIEEMINYFPYHYSPPTDGAPFAVNMETAQCPWKTEHRLLRIGLKGREIDRKNRGASNLVFLLDVSGSMNEANKLPLVKEAMKMLVGQLQEDDRVAIVTYASDTRVALPSARGNEREKIESAINALQAGGCTYGSGGIQLAYQQAIDHFVPGGVNRVILCTDGDLNVGVTRDEELVEMIQEKAKSNVFLTVLGFGEGNLKDSKMQKLADKGNGIYAYIDSMREAHRVLVEQMTGSLVTIAKDVKIQIEFNPAAVAAYRLIGYEKRILANQDFNDDKKDAGEIGAGHTVTAIYELVPAGSQESGSSDEQGLKYQRVPQEKLTPRADSGELLTLKIRYKEPEQNASKLLEFTAKDSDKRFAEATPDFRFAASVATFGMKLRSSPYCGNLNYAAVAEFAAGSLDDDPNGYRAEFLDLVREAGRLTAGSPQ